MSDVTHRWRAVAIESAEELQAQGIPYCFEGAIALSLQGIDILDMDKIEISVQWDLFAEACNLFAAAQEKSVQKNEESATCTCSRAGILIALTCYYNSVIVTDPDRVDIEQDGHVVWVKSFEFFLRTRVSDDLTVQRIRDFLRHKQQTLHALTERAWNQSAYDAWVTRFGQPTAAAAQIARNPRAQLTAIKRHVGAVEGKRIANLLGSHGRKAVALALLGAEVTVVDTSAENAKYATEVAQAAGVEIEYIVSDVLSLAQVDSKREFDIVLMELGILHYFIDLEPLAQVVIGLLGKGGRMILQDFHPVSTKLITSKGRKHKVTGNYFDATLETTAVAFTKFVQDAKETHTVQLRKWTLGEIVTAIARVGLCIRVLEEEPNHKVDDMGIPKTFTLVAEKV